MDIHKNQQHRLAMGRHHWVAGDKSRLFHCLCSSTWELKKKTKQKKKKNQENPQKKVSKFKHVLALYTLSQSKVVSGKSLI